MTPCAVLFERLSVLRYKLHAEEISIQIVAASDGYYGPFVDALRSEIVKCLRDVNDLVVKEPSDHLSRLHTSVSVLERRGKRLFGEALALKIAPAIRGNLDNGMCRIGDRLLSEFAKAVVLRLPQLTSLSDSEFFGGSSHVIRLAYPARSVWDISILAHEFAHSFGPLWTVRSSIAEHPRDRFLMNAELGSVEVHDEYFCDLLATFLLGPAYVCTCILDRFTAMSNKDSQFHPSDAKRAWWILRGLELTARLVNDDDDKAFVNRLVDDQRDFWTSYVLSAGQANLSHADTEKLELAMKPLFNDLVFDLPLAPYRDLHAAWTLTAGFYDKSAPDLSVVIVRDVLNAAWFLRLDRTRRQTDLESIESWALNLLRRVC